MNFSKKILTILAIFCIIASAGSAFAADDYGYVGSAYVDDVDNGYDDGYTGSAYVDDVDDGYDGGYAGSNYEDGGYAGSNYQDDGGWAGSQYNETLENATAANQTASNQTVNGTTNTTAPVAANTTSNATIPDAVHNMLATGNPILILVIVAAVLGGVAVIRRNK